METVEPFAEIVEAIKDAGGEAFKYCFQCGKCDVVCPWNRVRRFSIRKIVRQAAFGLPEIELEDMWRCTTCGTCPAECPRGVRADRGGGRPAQDRHRVRRVPRGRAGRCARPARASQPTAIPSAASAPRGMPGPSGLSAEALRRGHGDPVLRRLLLQLRPPHDEGRGRHGQAPEARPAWTSASSAREEVCCGESIRKTGNEEVFKTLARQNIKTFIDMGVKRILVSSPHCYHTFVNEYPEFMVHFEVVHITRVPGGAGRGRAARARRRPVREEGHLARPLLPGAAQRHLRRAPGPAAEAGRASSWRRWPTRRENSLCCGGGGGRIWMDTPKGERFADLRVAQAKAVGAEVLVTVLPLLHQQLRGEPAVAARTTTPCRSRT